MGRYVLDAEEPFIVNLTHQGGDRNEAVSEPMNTVTGAHRGEKAVVVPTLVTNTTGSAAQAVDEPVSGLTTGNHELLTSPVLVGVGGRAGQSPPRPGDKPTGTGTAKADLAVVMPHLTKFRANSVGSGAQDPVPTVTANSFIERPGGAAPIGVVAPAFVSYAQQGGGNRSAEHPLQTATASDGDQNQVVIPTLITSGYGEREGQEPRVPGLDKPMGTAVAGGVKGAVVAPHLMTMRNAQKPFNEADRPTHTITSMGAHLHLVAAFLAQHNISNGVGHPGHAATEPVSTILHTGSHQGVAAVHMMDMHGSDMRHAPADEPLRALTAGGFHAAQVAAFLVKYYGTDQDPNLREPMHTGTTKDRFGLVTVEIQGQPYLMVDIGLRMLTPRELFRAQGFPETYIIDVGAKGEKLTKTAQVRMCGNSVCPQVAEALVWSNLIKDSGAYVKPRDERPSPISFPLFAEDRAAA